ncbi:mucoidy inhibitor MuiA family protein [Mastigocladopsis repens]|uniref:mucoidy inhibitor MuiA family protein n=1 Tax=Mastigocladopsis repens TaxID=221287 RepID=UPI00030F3718|nr:mucoidy inhibitor MuiA family protein [Mastigocladopsis repens]
MTNPGVPSVQKTVETEIVAVTVYTDQALVTRRGVLALRGFERELEIIQLPVTIETESIRVSGTGEVAVRLLGVSTEHVFSSEPFTERLTHLTRQIQQLEAEWNFLQAQVDGLALQSRFIEGLREKTEEPFAQSLSRKNLSLSETLDFLNFLGSQYSEYAIATAECKIQQQELDKQLQVLRQQWQQVQTPLSKESFSLSVAIEPAGAGEFELEVSYVVSRAGWTPLYDLRVSTSSNCINLAYLAEVTQSTGEDWMNVSLTLSTAQPELVMPPKLEAWYIDVLRPPEFLQMQKLAPVQAASVAMPALANGDSQTRETKEPQANLVAAETVIAESRQGSAVSFQLSNGGNIPSNGAPHKTTIFNDDFPCSFEYIAVPRLVSFAYLQANVKNSANGVTLLPGKANIFRDNTFVGITQLENIAPGQDFTLNLGMHEGLKIERDLVERQVDKKLIDNNRRMTYGYRIVITNLQNQEANLQFTEQLPISRNEQIKVRLSRSNPQIQVGEMGILEWALTLPPQGKCEIFYQFIVEHPPELTVIGLDI